MTSSRRRRSRTLFSVADLDKLESAFRLERYPGIYEREKLAAELGVTEDRIQVRMPVQHVHMYVCGGVVDGQAPLVTCKYSVSD